MRGNAVPKQCKPVGLCASDAPPYGLICSGLSVDVFSRLGYTSSSLLFEPAQPSLLYNCRHHF